MEFPLLASVPPEARRTLLSSVRRRTFARREIVVHEGDPADSLQFVSAGRLGVRVSTPDGESAMLRLLVPGDYFGEISLLENRDHFRTATVIALEAAETLSITSTAFRAVRAQHPAVEQVVMTALAQRVDDLSGQLLEAMYAGLDRRVHRKLGYLCEVYAEGQNGAVTIPLTQETLAEFVGGTRPSVNAVLQRLQDRGVVELSRGKIVVRNRHALAQRPA